MLCTDSWLDNHFQAMLGHSSGGSLDKDAIGTTAFIVAQHPKVVHRCPGTTPMKGMFVGHSLSEATDQRKSETRSIRVRQCGDRDRQTVTWIVYSQHQGLD